MRGTCARPVKVWRSDDRPHRHAEAVNQVSHHRKKWGREICLVNNPDYGYCSKIMEVTNGYGSSLHRHLNKTETFVVLSGRLRVELLGVWTLNPGDSLTILPGSWHSFQTPDSQCVFLEISTFHDDSDVQRLDASGPVPTSEKVAR